MPFVSPNPLMAPSVAGPDVIGRAWTTLPSVATRAMPFGDVGTSAPTRTRLRI
jgi:hypothetical protein